MVGVMSVLPLLLLSFQFDSLSCQVLPIKPVLVDNLELVILRLEVERLKSELAECQKNCPCPPGFQYLAGANGCYKVLLESKNWADSQQRCIAYNANARLVAVETAQENTAIVSHLQSLFLPGTTCNCQGTTSSKCFWTSGQRDGITSNCPNSYVWKQSTPYVSFSFYGFNYWATHALAPNSAWDQPDCLGTEDSVEYRSAFNYMWNDYYSSALNCPICEYKKPKPLTAEVLPVLD